ncbi:MAG: hypothetical protein U5L10_01405 [Candidatus Moranbacteria bacterium]|nr:hypothetical protein [Candidatus Moranbacteria bacterium]
MNSNQKTIDNLTKIISQKDFAGSFLFAGPGGTGKEGAAVELIRKVNKISQTDEKMKSGYHPDVIFIRPEEEVKRGRRRIKDISIDQIKDKIKQAGYFNYQAPKKFFVITHADKMTGEASNSLLKIMEEPPKDCLFLLVTAFEDRLLDTIRSRCSKVNFPLLNKDKLVEALKRDFPDSLVPELDKAAEMSSGRYETAKRMIQNNEVRDRREREIERFRQSAKGGINKAFDLAFDCSKDKEKLLEALDDWIYYLHNFAKESVLQNRDIRIQKKVFQMAKDLVELKINIEKTNINGRLALENYFVKFS